MQTPTGSIRTSMTPLKGSKPVKDFPTMVGRGTRMELWGTIAAIVAMAIMMLLPAPEGLSTAGQRTAALFLGALILWTTEAIPIAVTSILILALQPILGLNPLGPAF